MTRLLNRVFLAVAMSCAGALPGVPAAAYQQLLTYRIAGLDILAIAEGDHVDEDPWALALTVVPSGGMGNEIIIESDGGLDECKQQLEYVKGSKSDYIEIVIDMNASTMNGVLVIQCATFQGLFTSGQ
ncbi:hypothetical protein K1718_08910 [Roseibium porphyridii]|uniref:YbjN domain-containing protein n=1 Tax=Roseibium porphyridii TaxID=2866279 RepID=A0ABY8F7M1_9HYPH|nr:hypothetical protein [Roseibium sp. KMA01]WFE91462.1 hypothetical protein K1718_08910 [Roseibium sp. KMA01]